MDLDLIIRAATGNSTSGASGSTTTTTRPPIYKVVGIVLAVCSGLFIGTSFVLKKTGLLKANVKYSEEAGEGYGYLKNAWWWSGMTLMIIGEICNFVAYAFVDAILVTPLGALSVVVTTILSAIFLKERLSFVGKVGCFMCIIGSVVIVLNTPQQSSASTIQEMQHFVIAPGFLSYAGVIIAGSVFIALWAGPRYGKKSMLVYLSVCSLIGGLSVVATQGLGAAIVTQAGGTPQFNQWFLYVLLVFVITTLVTEIIFLNKALNIFNAALVTPTYYVYFTSATIVTSAILFQGFKGTAVEIITIVLGFLQICSGVILLQLSKSAKDVPDAAVFKGDLDQVRTVAEQEEHESEPKADAIRGTAALIRSFSKQKQRRELTEAKRVHEELLEPIGENEVVEWDGLRRRKTIYEPGSESPLGRRKSVHPPLGMAHFPNPDEEQEDEGPTVFRRALSILNPRRTSSPNRKGPETAAMALSDMDRNGSLYTNSTTGRPQLPHQKYSLPPEIKRETSIGLGGLQSEDTSYKSPNVHFVDGSSRSISAPGHPAAGFAAGTTAQPPHFDPSGAARRQFSFHNPFARHGRPSPGHAAADADDARPTTSSSRGSYFTFRRQTSGAATTEEERLGLVMGDSRQPAQRLAVSEADIGVDGGLTMEPEEASDDDDGGGRGGARQQPAAEGRGRTGRDPYAGDGYDDSSDSDEEIEVMAGARPRDRASGGGAGGAAFV